MGTVEATDLLKVGYDLIDRDHAEFLDLFGKLIVPLALGGNVFGWTADEANSHSLVDLFRAIKGNARTTGTPNQSSSYSGLERQVCSDCVEKLPQVILTA